MVLNEAENVIAGDEEADLVYCNGEIVWERKYGWLYSIEGSAVRLLEYVGGGSDVTVTAPSKIKSRPVMYFGPVNPRTDQHPVNPYHYDSPNGETYAIRRLIIPDSIVRIEKMAMRNANRLTSVVLGNGVTHIEFEAFTGLQTITELTVGRSVRQIREKAFYFAMSSFSKQTELDLGDSLLAIEKQAFFACYFKKYILPDTLNVIGAQAFMKNIYLEEIYIPPSIASIGSMAFSECHSLKRMLFPRRLLSYYPASVLGVPSSVIVPY
ncbi:MAG: leucine-rich repeat domain-containing protein [Oscillospiraceae bacterium]|jgi:hypothetical protein|nr:leucine-rich repeat domain-containing protein [Oscillospiraceae bacterium]